MKARDAIEDALREIAVLAYDEAPDAEMLRIGLRRIGRLLRGWQNLGYMLWLKAEQTVTLVAATPSYLLDPKPVRILSARRVSGVIETPMQELTRQEYDDLPMKSSAGVPTCFYLDQARLFVWPAPAAGSGSVRMTYEREIEVPANVQDSLDLPPEWDEAIVLGLAEALAPIYQRPAPVEAKTALALALSQDREGSVYFT